MIDEDEVCESADAEETVETPSPHCATRGAGAVSHKYKLHDAKQRSDMKGDAAKGVEATNVSTSLEIWGDMRLSCIFHKSFQAA